MSFAKILEKHGVNVTLRQVTTTEEDEIYGTVSESYTEKQTKAIIQDLKEEIKLERQGQVITAEAVAYVDPQLQISEQDYILYNNVLYAIARISYTGAYKKLFLYRVE